MNEERLIKEIRKLFSLNLYEARIWLALLMKGTAGAGEISDAANVPRSRTYDILESLEKKGFVVMEVSKPVKYSAIGPHDVIENLKRNIRDEAEQKIKELDELKESEIIDEINKIYKDDSNKESIDSISTIIKGRKNIFNMVNNLISNANKNILISSNADEFIDKSYIMKEMLRKAKEKGVDIKIVTNNTYLNKLNDFNENVAFSKENSSKFMVVDDKNVLIMLKEGSHPKEDLALLIKNNSFGKGLVNMFNHMWNILNQ